MKTIGTKPKTKKFSFRGATFFTKTLSGVCDFSKQYVHFATGWTFEGNEGVCSDLLLAVAKKFKLDENDELGLWMADKFKSAEQLNRISLLKADISSSGGNPDSRGDE